MSRNAEMWRVWNQDPRPTLGQISMQFGVSIPRVRQILARSDDRERRELMLSPSEGDDSELIVSFPLRTQTVNSMIDLGIVTKRDYLQSSPLELLGEKGVGWMTLNEMETIVAGREPLPKNGLKTFLKSRFRHPMKCPHCGRELEN